MTADQEERMVARSILDSPHVCVITTGADGVIRRFNKGAENLLGYKAEEVIGKQRGMTLHDPNEAKEHAAEVARQFGVAVNEPREGIIGAPLITGEPEERVWTYIKKDGTRCKVLLCVSILRDDSGKMQGFLGVSIPLKDSG